jgi:NodT family efflux transporter outer membrane factor (OMF) lipoprotein
MITLAISHNQDLAAAYASLRTAQEIVNVAVGNTLLPAIDLVGSGTRSRTANLGSGLSTSSNVFNVFNVSTNVSYVFDVFGGSRRQIESLRAQVDYQQFQLIAAYLTLTTNVVTTAITIASLNEQIRATKELIDAENKQYIILQKQFDLGSVSAADVLTQASLVNQSRASLTVLEKNVAINRHALAVLIGAYPDYPFPQLDLNKLKLPDKIPLSLPSALVRQRPDVRASEALLHAATASIGVATANLLPNIKLTGNYGSEASVPSQLFQPASKIWSIGTNITQPLFHGGALWSSRKQAIAQYDYAYAQYKQTVLKSFENVADVLRTIEWDARNLKNNADALEATRKSLGIITQQYQLGGTSYVSLLIAQVNYQNQMISTIQAKAAKFNDTAALFQALGGGWWNTKWCVNECL